MYVLTHSLIEKGENQLKGLLFLKLTEAYNLTFLVDESCVPQAVQNK